LEDKQTILLSSGPVQRLLSDLEKSDVHQILLKHKDLLGIPASQIVDQLQARRKAKEKLPLYYQTPGVVFPPPSNLEQCSSQATAQFKADRIIQWRGKLKRCADLTGGFGIDAYFLRRAAEEVHVIEPDANLLSLARYNHKLLDAGDLHYHNMTAEMFLQQTSDSFDLIFADPSRRTTDRQRVHALEHSSPNIVALKTRILELTPMLLVKTSPLFDIQAGISILAPVARVTVVAVENECKEVLFWCDRDYADEAEIEAVCLSSDGHLESSFSFTYTAERDSRFSISSPKEFIYEPNAAILKSGAFRIVASRYNLEKLHKNTHLYTSNELIADFPGRTFRVDGIIRGTSEELKQHFPDGKANVLTRNYPLGPDELKKKLKLKDGGDKFLLGFTSEEKKTLAAAVKL
jgi:hypothetical protein